jgi:hypothetical protein
MYKNYKKIIIVFVVFFFIYILYSQFIIQEGLVSTLTAAEKAIATPLGLTDAQFNQVKTLTPAQNTALFALNGQDIAGYNTLINQDLIPKLQATYNTCTQNNTTCSNNLATIQAQYKTCDALTKQLQTNVGLCNNFMSAQRKILQPSAI